MSVKRTLIAALIFILLVVTYVMDGRRREAVEYARTEAIHLFGADTEAITAIDLVRLGERVKLVRKHEDWQIQSPIEATADPEIINSLLNLLVAEKPSSKFTASGAELEKFGLAKPAYSIEVEVSGGLRGISFGQESPLAGQIYAVMHDGETVFGIARELADIVARPINELRDRRILSIEAAAIESFSITTAGRTLEAARTGEQWNISRPIQIAASIEAVGDFLQSIQIARIHDFVDTGTQELAALGLEAPTIAAFFTRGSERHSLLVGHRRIGEESPVYYAKRADSPTVFTITQELFMLLQARASDLRDKTIFNIARENVSVFELEFGNRITRLKRDDQGIWKFDDESGKRADRATVEQLLTRLLRINVADYLELQPTPDISGISEPYVRIRVANSDGTQSEGIETGRPHAQSNHVYARRIIADGTFSEIFLINSDEPGNFFLLPEAFEDKTIFSFDTSAVKLFTITAKNQVISFQREDEDWVATLTGGQEFYQIKATLAERYLAAVAGLQWRKQLNPADEADQAMLAQSGLDKSNGTFTFYDANGAELGRFDQGGFDQSAVFVRRGDGVVFATDRNAYAAFISALGALVQFK